MIKSHCQLHPSIIYILGLGLYCLLCDLKGRIDTFLILKLGCANFCASADGLVPSYYVDPHLGENQQFDQPLREYGPQRIQGGSKP